MRLKEPFSDKNIVDHALRVGFRNKPDLEAYFLANKKDKNSKISIEQGELVTLKPGSTVIGQDGTEFIQNDMGLGR